MTNVLIGGDYVPDGTGGFRRDDSGLSEALFRMSCRRGSFPWLPWLGSRFGELGREKASAQRAAARRFAEEALERLPLRVEDAAVSVSGDTARVRVTLTTAKNETVEVTV